MEQAMPRLSTLWEAADEEDRPGPPPAVNQSHVPAACVVGWHNWACPEGGGNWVTNLCGVPPGQTQCTCTHTS